MFDVASVSVLCGYLGHLSAVLTHAAFYPAPCIRLHFNYNRVKKISQNMREVLIEIITQMRTVYMLAFIGIIYLFRLVHVIACMLALIHSFCYAVHDFYGLSRPAYSAQPCSLVA